MYFAYIYGEPAELSALDAALPFMGFDDVPVIEPSASNLPQLEHSVHGALKISMRIAIVVNPPATAGRDRVDMATILNSMWEWQSLTHLELFWPAIVIDETQSWQDTLKQVEQVLGPKPRFLSIHRRPNPTFAQANVGRNSLYHRAILHMNDPDRLDLDLNLDPVPDEHSSRTAIFKDPFRRSGMNADHLSTYEVSFTDVPARYAPIGALDFAEFADFTSTRGVPLEVDLDSRPITIPWTSPHPDMSAYEKDAMFHIFAPDSSAHGNDAEQQFAEAGAKFLAWWKTQEKRSEASYTLESHIRAEHFPGRHELKILCIQNHLESMSSVAFAKLMANQKRESAAWQAGRSRQR